MSEQSEILDQWITYFKKALQSPKPRQEIRKFFLDIENEAYNRALEDVARSCEGETFAGKVRGKILAMQLSKADLLNSVPRKADVLPFTKINQASREASNDCVA